MAYSRCSRVRAAASPRRHQAAASCWRRRCAHARQPARRAQRAVPHALAAAPSGCAAAHRSIGTAAASLPESLPAPLQIMARPTTLTSSPCHLEDLEPGDHARRWSRDRRRARNDGSITEVARERLAPAPDALVAATNADHGPGARASAREWRPSAVVPPAAAAPGITVLVLRCASGATTASPLALLQRAGVHGRS